METIQTLYAGAKLVMPSLAFNGWPGHLLDYKDFSDCYCGAGHGLGEKLVPDYIFSLFWFRIKISPACWIHDNDWDLAEPTREAFAESNDRFQDNINAIITSQARYGWVERLARYRAATYRNAVDGPGERIFWALKKQQGYDVPEAWR